MTEMRDDGVQFPEENGRRSSTRAAKRILSQAAAPVDQQLAEAIAGEKDLRKTYIEHMRALVEAGISSPQAALDIATAGLTAARSEVVFLKDGNEMSLSDAMAGGEDIFETETIVGEGEPTPDLRIPYRGRHLQGQELIDQMKSWETAGFIEPSCTQAVKALVDSPEWLDLSDLTFVVTGAASEMGPLRNLLAWGAHVIAIDLPRPALWEHIIEVALAGRGRLSIPVRRDRDGDIVERAGMDLLTESPETARWLARFEGQVVFGNYVYADGANFVRLATAVDALYEQVDSQRGGKTPLAYLATPTDVYAVPSDVMAGARARHKGGIVGAVGAATHVATLGRLFTDNYRSALVDEHSKSWGISDCLVAQQGANYALAKHIQRWRAIVARDSGHVTSANLAPATRTKSVVKNRVLAAAYAGASRFGVEIFASSTSAALMSALLVHDLRDPKAPADPQVPLDHPYELLVDGAAHGGLLRLAHEPRSVLPLAVLLGFTKTS